MTFAPAVGPIVVLCLATSGGNGFGKHSSSCSGLQLLWAWCQEAGQTAAIHPVGAPGGVMGQRLQQHMRAPTLPDSSKHTTHTAVHPHCVCMLKSAELRSALTLAG